jgi:hypothetical protein
MAVAAVAATPAGAAPPKLLAGSVGTAETTWGSTGHGNGEFVEPTRIAIGPDDEVFVADEDFAGDGTSRVQRFDRAGNHLDSWGVNEGVGSLAVDPSGTVYASTITRSIDSEVKVEKFTSDGSFVTSWGVHGEEPGSASEIYGIDVDPAGNVIVLVNVDGRRKVQTYDPSGNFVSEWTLPFVPGVGQIVSPKDLAVDSVGNVWVSEEFHPNQSVWKFGPTGAFLGRTAAPFSFPSGVSVDAADNLWVADRTGADQISKFDDSASLLARFTVPPGTSFSGIEAVAADSAGRAFVVDPGNDRVRLFGPTTLEYVENDVAAVDPQVDAVDDDSANLDQAEVAISDNFTPGEDELRFTDQNGISGAYAAGVLALTGSSSVVDYEAALRSVRYVNTSDSPSTATRTVTFTAGDGAETSRAISREITVTQAPERPVVAGTGTTPYAEQDPATDVAPAITVSDGDEPDLESARVELTDPKAGDELLYATTNGLADLNPAANVIELSATTPIAAYEAALRAVQFRNPSDRLEPGDRHVTFSVSDGDADSDTATQTIEVTAEPPTVIATAAALDYTENDPAVVVDPGVTVADADDDELDSAEVELVDPKPGDELAYATTAGVSGTVNAAEDTVTFSAGHSTADYQAAMRAISFRNSSEVPSTVSRSVAFEVSDGVDSSSATRAIDVTAVDDPVSLAGTATDLDYTENDPATPVDSGLEVADLDDELTAATVSIVAGYRSDQDRLEWSDQNGITGGFDTDTGVLTLSGAASVASYRAALRSVRYLNSSETPATATRTVEFEADDGSVPSNRVSRMITVASVNDVPTLSARAHSCPGCPTGTWDYTEQAGAIRVANSVLIADLDDENVESARIVFADPQAGDELLYSTTNGLADVDPAANVIELTGTASIATYAQALRSAQFRSDSDDPGPANRHFTFTVSDGDDDSADSTVTVRVIPVNDAATLRGTATGLAYIENDPATAVDPGLTVADPDDLQQDAAEVRITDPRPGDELDYATTNGMDATINGAKDTVTFANGDEADIEAALRAVKFRSTSDDPTAADRHVTFFAYDGGGNSNVVERTINVAPVNDPPGAIATPAALDYVESDPATAVDPGLALADPDDADLDSAAVELTDPQPGDELSYATTNGVAGTVNAAKDTVTFSGANSKSDYERALRAVRYRYSRDDPSLADRTVFFEVNDGDASSAPATRSISLAARPPSNAAAPALSGRARQGSSLAATDGAWQGTGPIRFAHRWQRCSAAGGGCADIAGAKGRDYVARAGDVGGRVRVVVTADNPAAGTVERASEPSSVIRGAIASPSIDEAPPAETQASDARFAFSGEEGASFECSLDGSGFESCGSPREFTGLATGEHRFAVRQSTDDGLLSEPTSHAWRIAADDDLPRGTPGADRLIGTPGADWLFGLDGDDWILGRQGDDRLIGGRGADHLDGARGDDVVKGNEGRDEVIGGPGEDELAGNGGRDSIDAADGDRDEVSCGLGKDRVEADGKDDVDRSCERVSRTGSR